VEFLLLGFAIAGGVAAVVSYQRTLRVVFETAANERVAVLLRIGSLQIARVTDLDPSSGALTPPVDIYARSWWITFPKGMYELPTTKFSTFGSTRIRETWVSISLWPPAALAFLCFLTRRFQTLHTGRTLRILVELIRPSNRCESEYVRRNAKRAFLCVCTFIGLMQISLWAIQNSGPIQRRVSIPGGITLNLNGESLGKGLKVYWNPRSRSKGRSIVTSDLYVKSGRISYLCIWAESAANGLKNRRLSLGIASWNRNVSLMGPLRFGGCGLTSMNETEWESKPRVMCRSTVSINLWFSIPLFLLPPSVAFFLGPWRRSGRVVRGLCARCGYYLKGLAEPRCPECGLAIKPVIRGSFLKAQGRSDSNP